MVELIALSGPAGSGKSTAATYLVECHGFTLVKFATPLKNMLRAIGLTEREIEGELKEIPNDKLCGRTPRYAMQTLGASWGRGCIDPNLWTTMWKKESARHTKVVCDDVRFENEVKVIHNLGGIVVNITGRGGIDGNHVSEQGIDPDLTVSNTGSISELRKNIERIYQEQNQYR